MINLGGIVALIIDDNYKLDLVYEHYDSYNYREILIDWVVRLNKNYYKDFVLYSLDAQDSLLVKELYSIVKKYGTFVSKNIFQFFSDYARLIKYNIFVILTDNVFILGNKSNINISKVWNLETMYSTVSLSIKKKYNLVLPMEEIMHYLSNEVTEPECKQNDSISSGLGKNVRQSPKSKVDKNRYLQHDILLTAKVYLADILHLYNINDNLSFSADKNKVVKDKPNSNFPILVMSQPRLNNELLSVFRRHFKRPITNKNLSLVNVISTSNQYQRNH